MAKGLVKAPFKFDYSLYKIDENLRYLKRYKETDLKGNYFYWDKFKYRIDKGDDVNIAWWSTKLARVLNSKNIEYIDKDESFFSFCIPANLEAKLHQITMLSSQGIVPSKTIKQKYLISSLLMEEAISSAQLEGASTTREIAKKMLSVGREANDKDEEMILNNYLLMQEVKRIKDEDLSIDMILDLHQIATKGNNENGNIPGKLRKKNNIAVYNEQEIVHQPPNFKELEKRLAMICEFANKKHLGEDNTLFINPIVKSIILHFMIGYEHPFADGNGRTARAIFYWFMLKNGFTYFEYISISKLLKKAPKGYGLSYLYTEIDDNDLTYFISYQINIIIRAIDELLSYLQNKSIEFEEISKLLNSSDIGRDLNFVQKDIVKKAIKEAGRIFIVKEISNDYDISENTARTYLKMLVKNRILIEYKDGRSMGYIAPSNLREVFL